MVTPNHSISRFCRVCQKSAAISIWIPGYMMCICYKKYAPLGDKRRMFCFFGPPCSVALIKTDIKTTVAPMEDTYPTTAELKLAAALDFIPASLRFLLQNLLVGKDASRKVAGIGQAVVQAVRPRAVSAPLQLGVAVQMHHLHRSRFLIDSLSTMGFASSYPEVQRFELNAACSLAPDVLGGDMDILGQSLLFAEDNVNHNIITLDGKGTSHGMGIIAAIIPWKQVVHGIPRQKTADLKFVKMTNHRHYRLSLFKACQPLFRISVGPIQIWCLWSQREHFWGNVFSLPKEYAQLARHDAPAA